MAAGDSITQDWQMEAGSLLTGDGTDYDIVQIDGLADLAEVRSQDRPLLLRHGSVPGLDFLGVRVWSVTFEVVDETDLSTKMDALASAFAPSENEQVFAFQIPGVAEGVKTQVSGRVRRRSVPIGLAFAQGVAEAAFEIHCTDPRIYSQVQNTENTNLSVSGGGMTFNASFDLTFGAAATAGFTLANDGNFDAPVVFRIDGPVTNPSIENVTAGKTLSFDIVLSASQFLEIDTANRTILLNGTASRYSKLEVGSEWFDLAPGNNDINFGADVATSATLQATWRDAWS